MSGFGLRRVRKVGQEEAPVFALAMQAESSGNRTSPVRGAATNASVLDDTDACRTPKRARTAARPRRPAAKSGDHAAADHASAAVVDARTDKGASAAPASAIGGIGNDHSLSGVAQTATTDGGDANNDFDENEEGDDRLSSDDSGSFVGSDTCSSSDDSDSDAKSIANTDTPPDIHECIQILKLCGMRDVIPMLDCDGLDVDQYQHASQSSLVGRTTRDIHDSDNTHAINRPMMMSQLYHGLRSRLAQNTMSAITVVQNHALDVVLATPGPDFEELASLWIDGLAGRDALLWASVVHPNDAIFDDAHVMNHANDQDKENPGMMHCKGTKNAYGYKDMHACVEWAVAGHIGWKSTDANSKREPLHPHLEDVVALPITITVCGCPIQIFGLADGHGGRDAAAWFIQRVPHAVAALMEQELVSLTCTSDMSILFPSPESQQHIRKRLCRLFMELDTEFCEMRKQMYREHAARVRTAANHAANCHVDGSVMGGDRILPSTGCQPPDDGCTLNILVIVGTDWAISAHVGDSRTAIGEMRPRGTASVSSDDTTASPAPSACTLLFASQDHSTSHARKARKIHQSGGEFRALRLACQRQEPALVRVIPPFADSTISTTTRAGRVTRSPDRSASKRPHQHHRPVNEKNQPSFVTATSNSVQPKSYPNPRDAHREPCAPTWTRSRYLPVLANARVARPSSFDTSEFGLRLKNMGLADSMGDVTMKLSPALFECVPDVEFILFPRPSCDVDNGDTTCSQSSPSSILAVVASDGVWDLLDVPSNQADVKSTDGFGHDLIEIGSQALLSATAEIVHTFDEYTGHGVDTSRSGDPVCGAGFTELDRSFMMCSDTGSASIGDGDGCGGVGDECGGRWSHPGIGTSMALVHAAEAVCVGDVDGGGLPAVGALLAAGRARRARDDATALLVRVRRPRRSSGAADS